MINMIIIIIVALVVVATLFAIFFSTKELISKYKQIKNEQEKNDKYVGEKDDDIQIISLTRKRKPYESQIEKNINEHREAFLDYIRLSSGLKQKPTHIIYNPKKTLTIKEADIVKKNPPTKKSPMSVSEIEQMKKDMEMIAKNHQTLYPARLNSIGKCLNLFNFKYHERNTKKYNPTQQSK